MQYNKLHCKYNISDVMLRARKCVYIKMFITMFNIQSIERYIYHKPIGFKNNLFDFLLSGYYIVKGYCTTNLVFYEFFVPEYVICLFVVYNMLAYEEAVVSYGVQKNTCYFYCFGI